MATNKLQDLQRQLSTIYGLLQNNHANEAQTKLKPLVRKWPKNPDVAHLMALCLKALGDKKSAINYFQRTLSLNSKQPQVHNNLANCYKDLLDYNKAEKHYLLAISLQENFIEAMKNLALCYFENNNVNKAMNWFEKASSLNPDDVVVLIGIGDCYRDTSDFESASKFYKRAIALSPQQLNPHYKLGQSYHLNGQLPEAIERYKFAYQIAPKEPAVIISLATILHETGETETGFKLFQKAIQEQADNALLHERYNELLWESEYAHQFGESYQYAISNFPNNLTLRKSYISQLFRAGRTDMADQSLTKAIDDFPDEFSLLFLKGQIQADQGSFDMAQSAFEEGLAHEFDKDAAQGLVKVYIINGDYLKAQRVLDQLLQAEQDCQLNWALQSLVWRLTDNSQYSWLNQYEHLVKSYVLKKPAGYSSLADYLENLTKVLLSLHKTEHAPLQQTLRHGTQTAARLFHRHEPEIQELKSQLSGIVSQYIDSMPEDPTHPLLRRKSLEFEFSGSWSVKLQPNGFHVNHVHPAGWISSSCYISIPANMGVDPEDLQGCIKFGESPLPLGDLDVIEKSVKPEPGMVVLFPSYMWHGTYPFAGEQSDFRLTSPFDITPI